MKGAFLALKAIPTNHLKKIIETFKILLIAMGVLLHTEALAQEQDSIGGNLIAIGVAYNDDYSEWNLFNNDTEDPVGHIRMRWKNNLDWSEWDFRYMDKMGEIKMKNKGNLNFWELRMGNEIISFKTIYPDDYTQWRITNDTKTLTFKSIYENVYDGWKVSSVKSGGFELYTEWEMDPRDWLIKDTLSKDYSDAFKLSMLFISTYFSSPKY